MCRLLAVHFCLQPLLVALVLRLSEVLSLGLKQRWQIWKKEGLGMVFEYMSSLNGILFC